ncbi:hypothetical protein O1C66_003692 [Vibrio cholerae]|nr:hypothetical protein [Vibrio cholerae]
MFKQILTVVAIIGLFGCAQGGQGGRDGGDASVEIGDIEPVVETCVGTTVECNEQ